MAIDPELIYGTVEDADAYFATRLHSADWAVANEARKEAALLAATRDVDTLKYSGYKDPVAALLAEDPLPSDEAIAAADAEQPKQFPRDGKTTPDTFYYAVYEIAYERLRGRDPQQEFENLSLTNYGSGSTRESRDVSGAALRHLANGIVSRLAFVWLLPLLADNNTFDVRRV